MATRIQLRRDTAANWTSADPTLAQGELGYETDTGKLKLGDGLTAWTSLAYYYTTANLNDISDVTITDAADGDFLRWNGAAWINDAVNLGTDSVGDYVESVTGGTGVTVLGGAGEGAAASVSIGQDVGTTADVTFNTVSANISGDVTGNADTASALETPRVIQISGDVAGSVSFDGSTDVNISATVQPNSVSLGVDTAGDYVENLTAGTGVTVDNNSGEGSSPTISIGQAVGTSDSVTFAAVNAPLTGDVTGNADTASALQTPRTFTVDGDVAGSVSFDGSSDVTITATVQPDSVALGTDTTGDYVQDLTAGTGVTVTGGTGEGSSPTVYIGQDVATSASVTFANVTATGDVVVGGNLTVNGDTTTLNVSQLYVEDNIINLNVGQSGDPSLDAGIEVVRGDENNTSIKWDENENKWTFTNNGVDHYYLATQISDISDVTITSPQPDDLLVYDNVTGRWENRAPILHHITDVDAESAVNNDFLKYNGASWVAEAINLGTDTTGSFVQSLVAGTGVSLADNSGENATPTISIGQAVGTTDDVTFNTVTASLSGNASTASALQTGRTISLSGDVTGSVSFDGSANVDISATIAADSVALGTDTTGDYVESVAAGTGVTVFGGTGEGAAASVAIGQDVGTTADVTFNTVTASLTGNADTASALETARVISLGGDLAGSVSFDGSSDVVLSAQVQADFDSIDALSDVAITSAANGEILQFDGTNWVNTAQATSEPMGIEVRTDSTIAFNDGTRQFSIAPASISFTVWCKGKRFVKTSTETVTIGTTTGLYYIYFNTSGVLSYKTTYFDWENDTPVAYVYWNATTSKAEFFADERHGIVLDWQTHEYLHRTRGAALASGFGISGYTTTGDGDSDAHTQIALAGGTFFDEDLQVDIVHSATPTANSWEQVLEGTAEIPVLYLSGTEWRRDTATTSPFKAGTARPVYNLDTSGTWSTPDVANNKYGVMWIVATNDTNEPVIAILGQVQGDNQSQIEEHNWEDVSLPNFPIVELRPLYKIIFLASDGMTNTLSAAIRGVTDIRRVLSTGSGVPGETVSDHGSMTGLGDDDHLHYLTTGRHDAHDHSTAMSSVVLNDVSDVSASSPSSGDFLKWSGAAWVNDPVNLGTDTVGGYVESLVAGTGVSLANNSGEGATPTVAIGQDVGTTADVTFNTVSADVTGALTGNASTATALQTARVFQISGDAAGSVSFDGTADVNIAVTVQPDSVALGTDTSGDYVQSLVAGTGVTLANNSGETATPTVSIGQAVGTSDDVTFNTVTLGASPTQATHVVTKSYVDNIAAGIDWHEAARLATAAVLPNTPAYDNGISGAGATLTSSTEARLVVDGSNANTGDRILVKNQATGSQNGIYVVTNQGASGSAFWVLTRADDFDGSDADVNAGEAVFVLAGSTNARQGFVVTSTSAPHSIGSDTITFTQFTGTQAFTAGTGLAQSGNTLNVGTADVSRIVVNADDIDLATVSVGSTSGSNTSSFVSSVTTDSYGRVTSVETSSVGQGLDTTDSPTFVTVNANLTGNVTGNVSGNVTGDLTGNADSATALETPRVFQLSGDVSGSVSFDGTADATITTVIGADSVALGTDTTGNYTESVTGGTGVTVTGGTGEGNTPTVAIGQAVGTTDDVTFNSVSANLTGNVTGTVSDISNHSVNGLSDVDMVTVSPAEGDIFYFDGSNWVAQPFDLANSGDVTLSGTPDENSILIYQSSVWTNASHTLENIADVVLTTPSSGEFLKFDGSNWVNANVPIISALGDIGDVSFTSLTSDEAIKYDGANWVNYDPLASPAFTGTPTAPTAAAGTSTTQIATTAFVSTAVADLVDLAPDALNTLNELAAALGDDANFSTTVTNSLALKAPLASPTFTGTVTLPAGTNILHDFDAYGANHTLVLGNAGHTLEVSTTATITIPTNASVAFPVGTTISIIQTGTGTVTVSPASGVTLNYAVGAKTREQWSMITLHKRSTNTWLLTGDAKA